MRMGGGGVIRQTVTVSTTPIIPSGLVTYYAGNTLYDTNPNNVGPNHLTAFNGATPFGPSLPFLDYELQFAQSATSGLSAGPLTLCLWAMPAVASSANWVPLGLASSDNSSVWNAWYCQLSPTGVWQGVVASNNSFATSNGSSETGVGQWDFICVVVTSSQVQCFVNAVGGSAVSMTAPVISAGPNTFVGAANPASGVGTNAYFAGTINEIRVYNRALSQAEITAIYFDGRPRHQTINYPTGFLTDTRYMPPGVYFRDFSSLAGYASNPIMPMNTNTQNTKGVSGPMLQPFANISGTYYSPVFETTTAHSNLQGWQIGLYTSATLLATWTANNSGTPILTNVDNTWEHQYLLHPCIAPLKIGGNYVLYYSAQDSNGLSAIGMATSSNLTSWTKYGSNPIIQQTSTGRPSYPSLPWVIQIGSQLVMYTSVNNNLGTEIVYWTSPSTDGINWTYGGVVLPTPVSGDWDDVANQDYLDAFVFKNSRGFYEMAYTVGGTFAGSAAQKIGYAVSSDGFFWRKYYASIAGGGGSFSPGEFIGDCVFYQDGTTFYAFYNYDDGVSTGDGRVATMTDH